MREVRGVRGLFELWDKVEEAESIRPIVQGEIRIFVYLLSVCGSCLPKVSSTMATGALGRLPGCGFGIMVCGRAINGVHRLFELGDSSRDRLNAQMLDEGAEGGESLGQTLWKGQGIACERRPLDVRCRRWLDSVVRGRS